MNKFFVILVTLMSFQISNATANIMTIEDSIKRLNWNGIEVVYIEDNRFPTFDLTIYFADGVLSENNGQGGLTYHSFNLIDLGTDKLSQKEILDQLEFLGTYFDTDIGYRSSNLNVSGLTKDLNTSIPLICSLLRTANFPETVLKKQAAIERGHFQKLVSSHNGLTQRIFREITMSNTPYSYPVLGKMEDLKALKSEGLRNHLNYFLNSVKKRIYLTGPKSVLELEKILINECHLKGSSTDYVRLVEAPKIRINKTEFVFVPVPDATQVQLRIGRFINHDETSERNLDTLASEFLGGGFTSPLMQEVREKRGLSYNIQSFISTENQYGRSEISSSTKNHSIDLLIEVIDETIAKISKEGITETQLKRTTDGLIGAYPFKFEKNKAFLGRLLFLDHIGRPYSDLFDFKESVAKYKAKDVAEKIKKVFSMESQVILVLGDKSIEPKLKKLTKKYGPLKVIDYKPYL